MENLYCTIFIVDVSHNPEEAENITSRVQQLIEDHGGVIKRHNPWGKRRLAYPIEKKTSGFYVEIEYAANSRLNIPQTLEKEFRLNDRVMRFLTYVVSKDELIQREINAKRGIDEKPALDATPGRPARRSHDRNDRPASSSRDNAPSDDAEENEDNEPEVEETNVASDADGDSKETETETEDAGEK
ncbi:MAG TPA: 30S ribosomal protein S6 [Calditrichia bacterium]|nr:30S ribosomal protein S6 [Calditrichota bacterium]HQU73748.1 30S ribosomal protein S6 [Calditrichia bacterium]HQV30690.1 30S ribosomal protein S6 [Calditrichia bacterium]